VTGEREVGLRSPPGRTALPPFDRGWDDDDGQVQPFLSYVDSHQAVNWSPHLEAMHEESSRRHFIDVWTRRAILTRLGPLEAGSVVVDLGCSTGYLLAGVRAGYPGATLVGIDLVGAGLRKAHVNVPEARLVQADACALPLADSSVDAAVSANLLEHVPDDQRALAELRRVLRPGAPAVLVVPAGARVYDYYDRFLGHERRYARGELSDKARRAGLEVLESMYLGSLLYPAFWLVKQRNRRRYDHLRGVALERRVAADIARTRDSRVGRLACRLEEGVLRHGVRLPFGIRELLVIRRPRSGR
jgi:ubiquinone/menaquinone biosynthesis C-methylase UbiE